MLVVDGGLVREVLERDQEFTVEPYGVEMTKVMSPDHNGGFNTFVLSTDDNPVYEPDKRLLSAVCNRGDAEQDHRHHPPRVRSTRRRRRSQRRGPMARSTIDVVDALARYVPVTLGHGILAFPSPRGPDRSSCPPRR